MSALIALIGPAFHLLAAELPSQAPQGSIHLGGIDFGDQEPGRIRNAANCAQHVDRLVCETALGLGDSAGRMGVYYTLFLVPVILPLYFWDKTRQERVIAASRLDWIVVRPGMLTNGARRGRYRHGSGLGSVLWTVRISRADVADFMLSQLVGETYLRRSPGVCW